MKRLKGLYSVAAGMVMCIGFGASVVADPYEETPTYSIASEVEGWGAMTSLYSLNDMGARETASQYFDKAMQYDGTRFTALPFEKLFEEYKPGSADAVLLDCFDDYQGLLSIEDIKRYKLELATRIYLPYGIRPPSWLKPLIILVPDGVDAPFQERFLTANIEGLAFVKLADYYAPLDRVAADYPEASPGLNSFKDNCVYCHSLKGVGGNKGGSLLKKFDFSKEDDRESFKERFSGFHHEDNADKQNVEQFVDRKGLEGIVEFLRKVTP